MQNCFLSSLSWMEITIFSLTSDGKSKTTGLADFFELFTCALAFSVRSFNTSSIGVANDTSSFFVSLHIKRKSKENQGKKLRKIMQMDIHKLFFVYISNSNVFFASSIYFLPLF